MYSTSSLRIGEADITNSHFKINNLKLKGLSNLSKISKEIHSGFLVLNQSSSLMILPHLYLLILLIKQRCFLLILHYLLLSYMDLSQILSYYSLILHLIILSERSIHKEVIFLLYNQSLLPFFLF